VIHDLFFYIFMIHDLFVTYICMHSLSLSFDVAIKYLVLIVREPLNINFELLMNYKIIHWVQTDPLSYTFVIPDGMIYMFFVFSDI